MFENSKDFRVVSEVFSDEDMSWMIRAGKAQVGIKIPEVAVAKVNDEWTVTIDLVALQKE